MSTSGFNYIYKKLGIRSDALKIYYDFSGIHGGQIPSVSGASLDYPADIVGNINISDGTGYFDSTISLSPQGTTGGFDTENWSMYFNYEKKNSEECILFDSLNTGYISSGFQIGLTDANKVYFHFYGSGQPYFYTSDNVIGSKNVINVTKQTNRIEFSYYDFNNKRFETEYYPTEDRFLFHSDQFNLFQDFSGNVEDYIYLDGNVSYSNRQRLCSGFFLDPSYVVGRIGVSGYELYKTGHIDGNNKLYETGLKLLTGNINYSNTPIRIENSANLQYFGVLTDDCDVSDDLYLYNGVHTGKLSANNLYPLTGFLVLDSHISGGYVESIEVSGIQVTGYTESQYPIFTGITGTIQETYIDYVDECGRTVFGYRDVYLTGVLSGEQLNPETGWVTTNLGSGLDFWKSGAFGVLDVDSSAPFKADAPTIYSYGMEFVTYIDEEDTDDLQEIIIFPNRHGVNYFSKRPFYDSANKLFVLDRIYTTGAVNLFLNGLLQYQSGYNISGDVFNVIFEPQADYFLSGANIRSNFFYDTGDVLVYDSNTPSAKKIATYNYATDFSPSGVFTKFPIFESDLVFVNGQKMYSGINYQISGGSWMEPLSGMELTGTLTTIKKYIGERSLTGSYNKFTTTKFPRNTSVYFLNGVRIPRDQYIEHSSIDLISGDNISLKGAENLYNNDGILGFWD